MSSLKDLASLIMIPSLYKDGELHTVKPLADENVIVHPDATDNNDGFDGSTPSTSSNFTFSRGSNLAATRVDVNGLIEKGRENLLLQSNQFDTTWAFGGAISVSSGQSGYDGSSDAWSLTKTATIFANITQSVSHSGIHTFSVYAKQGTNTSMILRSLGGTDAYSYFDLSAGTITGNTSNIIDSQIQAAGNGFYRCSITYNASSNTTIAIYPEVPFTGTSAGNIYIQDAQLEQGLVATDYIETGTSAAQSGILEDMPRLDYSGGASCPSLLLEPQRSNVIPQSEYIHGWLNAGGTSSQNSTDSTSPEGLYNSAVLDASSVRYRSFSISSSANSYSVYAKAKSGSILGLRIDTPTTKTTNFDLSDGTIQSTGSGHTASIEAVGDGWYRCIISFTDSIVNAVLQTTSSGSVYVWGAQLEAGSYPTSYIPTYGTSQTRSADFMANLDIPDFNDNTSFSVLLELTRNGISSSEIGSMFSFYNDSLTQQFWFHIDAPNSQVRLRDATNSNATMATISFDTDDRKKIAFSCDGSTLKTYADGVLSNTYNLVNVFNVDELRTAAKSFDVHQILTFPTALTDSECIALTTL